MQIGHGVLDSGEKFGQDFVEGGDQAVDLTLFRGGADQHHVVEGRDQAAPVQEGEVQGGLELGLMGGGGLGPVVQRAGRADEFDPRADAHDMPGRLWASMTRARPAASRSAPLFHMGVGFCRHHLGQGGAQAGKLHRVGRQRGAHAGMARGALGIMGGVALRRQPSVMPQTAVGMPPATHLPTTNMSGDSPWTRV